MQKKFDIKYDVRVLERNLREGVITEKLFQEFLNKLKDTSENAASIETLSISEEQDISEEANNKTESEE